MPCAHRSTWAPTSPARRSTELECAEQFLGVIPNAEMVKFTKDGSTATSAALKLARAGNRPRHGRVCAEHPFFSYDDWFIATTTMAGGILAVEAATIAVPLQRPRPASSGLFAAHPDRIAAVFLEPVRTEPPVAGFLEGVRALCTDNGALLVFDEMITGFRYALHGAQDLYGVVPDLSTFGKALANGFSLSALCGKREFMRLGGRESEDDDVFLLSTTHGAELPALAAAVATIDVYEREPVDRAHAIGRASGWSPA